MNLDRVTSGKDVPNDINVIIEIPSHSDPVKYEVDKETGAMFVDRFMNTAMHYPCNYGYVPHTLSEDGDPVDVLVVTPVPLISGSVIRCRPIAVLKMTDEAGPDSKILAVPIDKLCTLYRQDPWSGRHAGTTAGADRALLRTLQGSGTEQVGEGGRLVGCGGRPRPKSWPVWRASRRRRRSPASSKKGSGVKRGRSRFSLESC